MQWLVPPGIAPPVGLYSHATVAPSDGDWIYLSGQIGVLENGDLPADFTEQAHAAWTNVIAILAAARVGVEDLAKVVTYLVDAAHLPLLGPVRQSFLGEARPASTLLVVKALARPDWLIEIEAVAFRPRGR